jgi:hypothetical protein
MPEQAQVSSATIVQFHPRESFVSDVNRAYLDCGQVLLWVETRPVSAVSSGRPVDCCRAQVRRNVFQVSRKTRRPAGVRLRSASQPTGPAFFSEQRIPGARAFESRFVSPDLSNRIRLVWTGRNLETVFERRSWLSLDTSGARLSSRRSLMSSASLNCLA